MTTLHKHLWLVDGITRMKRFARPLGLLLSLAILSLVVTIVPRHVVSAQNQNVQAVQVVNQPVVSVKNTPLPVSVTNTPLPVSGSVNVSNAALPVTGTVNATISNSSLSSLITNPANNPVLDSNVNDSTDREFTGSVCEADYSNPPDCNGTFDPFHNEFVSIFTLPTTTASGLPVTQAVIEYVSGSCRADLQDDIGLVGMLSSSNAAFYFAPVKLPGVQRLVFPVPGQNSPTTWQWSQTTKIYLPPGASLFLNVRSTGNQFELEECFAQFWGTLLTR